jgi:hypothetical protein
MGTNRNKRSHAYQGIALDPSIEDFFWSGEPARNTPGWSLKVSHFFDDYKNNITDAWLQHRDYLLEKWKTEKRKGTPWIMGKGKEYADNQT